MTPTNQSFRALHEQDGLFVIPNPWDVGSAKVLAGLGFKALATTSGGMAYALGRPDGGVSREAALEHCRAIVAATPLPVSGDLERGFGDTPEAIADIIRAASETGLAGCSIEDYTGHPEAAIYDQSLAVERIAAAHDACQSLPGDFVLTARCECLVWDSGDLDEVLIRLKAYEEAGADVLFAPGLNDLDAIRTVVSELSRPVNVIMSTPGVGFGLAELAEVGVKRVSIGSAFAQLAYGRFIEAAKEISERGTFTFADEMIDYQALEAFYVS